MPKNVCTITKKQRERSDDVAKKAIAKTGMTSVPAKLQTLSDQALVSANQPLVKLRDEIDLAGQRIARYDTAAGDVWVTYRHEMGTSTLEIINIGSRGGPTSLGVAGLRALRDDLMRRTGATTARGRRVSGSSIGREAEISTTNGPEGTS